MIPVDTPVASTLGDLERQARERLHPHVWDFLDGGAGREETLRANRAAFERWALRPRVLTGIGVPDLTTRFFGFDLALPLLTAPFGAEGQFDPEGHRAVARANAAHGVVSIVPEASSFSLEAVAEAAPAAARIAQLHPAGEPDHLVRMVERAAAAGYEAICVTADCPTAGWRERNRRNGFALADDVVAGNYPPGSEPSLDVIFGQIHMTRVPTWSWETLRDAMARGGLRWMVKGILTAEDARAAHEAGAGAVLVSNHGGRQLDGAVTALDQLPEVADALAGTGVQVALDSGVRTATDVVRALALGADAVVLGRLAAYGLAAAGEAGVRRVHELLTDELLTILTLCGRPDVASLDRTLLKERP